jgi:glycosyltransferase involved in cell wall biosynthesis
LNKKILFYDDSPVFGGHELMSIDYVSAAAESGLDVYVMYNTGCTRFRQKLDEINESTVIHIIPTNNVSQSPQGFRTLLSPLRMIRLAREFSARKIDLVVILQGNIEWCTLGMAAAKLAGIKIVSYIPMAHSMTRLNARLGRVRDMVNSLYYRLPDKYITISEKQKDLIIEKGCDPELIDVVLNYLFRDRSPSCTKEEARRRLGLPQSFTLIGLVGRTDSHGKRQDFFIRAVAKAHDKLAGYHFLIVGDGPDLPLLKEIVRQNGLGNMVSLSPWSNDVWTIYTALDALVIPSAYEGVPLVMLEAVNFGLPVIATNVDGMAEFLPEEWLFEKCDEERMISLLLACRSDVNTRLAVRTKGAFERLFDRESSRRKFVELLNAV